MCWGSTLGYAKGMPVYGLHSAFTLSGRLVFNAC